MPRKTDIILIATETDPVAAAVTAAFGAASEDLGSLRRIEPDDFPAGELGRGAKDVLLIGDSAPGAAATNKFDQIKPGLVQFLGCRPPTALVDHLQTAGTVVAGISPVIAPRVANRVVGLAGPLLSSQNVRRGESGPVWGIVGMGVTGTEVARKLVSTDATVNMADIRTTRSGVLLELGVRRLSLDLLVAGSDALTLHLYPGATAAPLITARELGLMKDGAVLINTSHSSIVDEEAVLEALATGPLGAYATDCPGDVIGNADASLASSGKLIITTNPLTNQIGAAQQIAKFALANVRAFLDGSNIEGKIDLIDFPITGDPSFWSSRMSPRQD
ncbi:MAG: NAD(P)-dependent oxidoreductase [Chloroflexi bacterium]|nr:NAD(P)-dependent oxidoreductase [Chloroflexota bacterium]